MISFTCLLLLLLLLFSRLWSQTLWYKCLLYWNDPKTLDILGKKLFQIWIIIWDLSFLTLFFNCPVIVTFSQCKGSMKWLYIITLQLYFRILVYSWQLKFLPYLNWLFDSDFWFFFLLLFVKSVFSVLSSVTQINKRLNWETATIIKYT